MNENFTEWLHGWVGAINDPMWSYLVYMLLGTGLFFTVTTGFVQFRLFGRSIKEMLGGRKQGDDPHGITPFQAFVTGLASRVGVGNIAGVAIAIKVGGPGAVFWMWVTALIGMSSAFVESSLAQLFKVRDCDNHHFRGGPAYYITHGLGQKWLGVLFALSLIFCFGFVFEAVQTNTIADTVKAAWGWEPHYVGVALVILTAPIIFGGIRRISKAAEIVVPLMAVLYLFIALFIILTNIPMIPDVFGQIFSGAFKFDAAAGGLLGGLISQTMMMGIKRGLYSNEAGMGSAPIAAAAAKTDHPVRQALVSMTGTFLDTIVVCSITGIVLVMGLLGAGGEFVKPELSGAALTTVTFQKMLPGIGGWIVTIGLIFFAYSTILGWCYYGEKCAVYVFGEKFAALYRVGYVSSVMPGTVLSLDLVWLASDTFNGLMALPNLTALLLMAKVIVNETRDFKQKITNGELPH
ncbi:sodium:alanine symporter family protein [Neisseria gonorrhoeae]